ncbi:MAG: hypothetical protein A3A43_00925 [Candidatus Liptonbacteria bacterium RIFCSPLOWO2_01_FULL_56_20]|uniref:PDZ domain-containing protein n=1 Tax=Candidatus Liptonbacteria bacterium RIFCSPLOWO2_01_FULL_56_20 TaxID=1798652 RepID=A0A1G2CM54_9BACT|nr:MAG: Carboxyl-terminal protease [Parcubacteria group bacterium GW2011_GWB1_56_8]OGZ01721.1 MAG: hypothetical protein A3A43_00925 [Candidatus Liptonbacteria bacterium RIFCSPLOWO2_01_FULL_56_20]
MRTRQFVLIGGTVVAVVALLAGGFTLGFSYGKQFPKVITIQGVTNLEDGKPVSVDFGNFWEAWQLIKENSLKEDVSDQDKVYGALRGLVASLGDPYSVFLPPEEDQKFHEDIEGNFGGIGAEIGIRKNQLIIVAPLKNTPASRAGLLAGDQILKVNASSTDGVTVDQAVRWIRGPKETSVTLTIFRNGWEDSKEFKITRGTIVVPTLDFEMKEDIAFVQLHSFNANANQLFWQALIEAERKGARGLILDLRNNPGGYLEVAVDIASWFLPRGTLVVSEASRTGTDEIFRANGNAALVDFPAVALINQGSASASEILAGALRDQRKMLLIGETSFGKGTVQQLLPLRDDSSVKLTIAHWVLPGGRILENEGLVPDIEVKISDKDVASGNDPQLAKALEVLRGEINR